MRIRMQKRRIAQLFVPGFLLLQACDKAPVADFSHEPEVNAEAGDTINFTNNSVDAVTYLWEFGDGRTSSGESPSVIYSRPGVYAVKLTAYGKKETDSIVQAIWINDPTVMAFYILEPDSLTVIPDCNVLVWDNEADFTARAEPQFSGKTDTSGLEYFLNLENIMYYILVYKETEEGLYIREGYTMEPLELNVANIFRIVMLYFPDTRFEDLPSASFEGAGKPSEAFKYWGAGLKQKAGELKTYPVLQQRVFPDQLH